jgi:hypothetical protein
LRQLAASSNGGMNQDKRVAYRRTLIITEKNPSSFFGEDMSVDIQKQSSASPRKPKPSDSHRGLKS